MKTRKIGIGAEGLLHKHFANIVRQYEVYKKLNCLFWTYSASGEYRKPTTGALLKAKGLKTGFADYHFIYRIDNVDHNLFIEFKAGKNKQSQSQIDFQNLYKDSKNSFYYVVYSVEEAINILIKHNVII
jgi:hypothetical protein